MKYGALTVSRAIGFEIQCRAMSDRGLSDYGDFDLCSASSDPIYFCHIDTIEILNYKNLYQTRLIKPPQDN